ncbi:3-ketosteroid-9-alpha-hydroxylase reductase subunit [Aquisphaera giovannonii]|uniref:Protein-methionine-sulfoxide reductase heme-binding subunit MsrQ n=1 Tax=Aquisphaera giovannonii TaxID=406548 RepID=A0A5B9W6F6_9BACT|nr:ferric reductase-like transmembrane domain-containing protein [Aquisphaera giovannonii]QEH36242.1 3-ketosteroid-9-alpha-hydroxylase reductase subunit [Aquisphaera giovannonii]
MRPGRFGKLVVLLNALVPVSLLAWDASRGRLGANPVNFAIRTTGILALIFLVLTLAITPAIRLTRLSWLGSFRRMMGLCAFSHAALHFSLFFVYDRNADLADTLAEMTKRPYLIMGTIALALMAPLAVTSTDRMVHRLGGRRWKALHRLVYPAAVAGVIHFAMLVKADLRRPLAFAAVIGLLLGYRLVAHYLRLRADSIAFRSGAAGAATATAAGLPRFWRGQLRVARIFRETPDVRTFRLVPTAGTRLPFEHLPGQYLNVSMPVEGRRLARSYTIASSPTNAGYCEITVKREEKGSASRHLHDVVREGDLLDVSAPAGRFTFTGADASGVVLIAGGVGITPLMAKIRYLTDIGWPGAIDLVYGTRTEDDVIFREELEHLRRRFPNLRSTVVLSRGGGPAPGMLRGRITPELLSRVVPDIGSRPVHLCGPTPMMDAMREMLRGLAVPEHQVHVESFVRDAGTPPATEESTGESPHARPGRNGHAADGEPAPVAIVFERSGRSGRVGLDRTILDAADQLGVPIPYDCRAGICGRCKTRLVSGPVAMDAEDALTPLDRSSGLILACQSRCLGDVIVDA